VANPVFRNSKAFQSGAPVGFETPSIPGVMPSDGRMSFDGTIAKAASLFLLAAASAVLVGMLMPALAMPLMIVGFVLALIVMFTTKNGPKPALMATTVAVYGGAVGGVSVFYEAKFGGIILQSLVATAVVFAVSLLAYRSGRIRNMGKVNKFLSIAAPAYVVFSLINVGMVMFGGFNMREVEIGGLGINLGLVLSLFAITVGAFMLISDFDFVANGVRNGLPAQWEWSAAYGLVFAIIWIYLEMLRLMGYLRR
jgi:uncharacterized YccA/Bax inhibitor family protein